MYKIEVLENKKAVYITTSGMFKREEGLAYLKELKETFNKLDTSKYYLIIDSGDFKTAFQEDLSILQEVVGQYEIVPFIKKFFIMPKSAIAKMQAKHVDKTPLPGYLIEVNSLEEALSMIK